MNDFTLREKILIKLMLCLLEFVGRKQEGFFSHKLESCFHELFYPKIDEEYK